MLSVFLALASLFVAVVFGAWRARVYLRLATGLEIRDKMSLSFRMFIVVIVAGAAITAVFGVGHIGIAVSSLTYAAILFLNDTKGAAQNA